MTIDHASLARRRGGDCYFVYIVCFLFSRVLPTLSIVVSLFYFSFNNDSLGKIDTFSQKCVYPEEKDADFFVTNWNR